MDIKEYAKEQDEHWQEVMKLCEKYGFILQAFGGVATLCTHNTYIEEFGEEDYKHHMKNMYNIILE